MSNLKSYFSYKKFTSVPYRVLFLSKSYFLQQETIECLQRMGHFVQTIDVINSPKKMLDSLLKTCVQFKPDCVLGMNHIGFDPEGKIANILAEFQIPVLFWYLDDFRFIIGENKNHVYPNTVIFTFEKNNIQSLKKMGFDHVFYLPTATALDPEKRYFTPKYSFLSKVLSFVGSTFELTKEQWHKPGFEKLLQQIELNELITNSQKPIVDNIIKHQIKQFESKNDLYKYAGYVAACVTQKYRVTHLQRISAAPVHIFGDKKWNEFDLRARIHPSINNITVAPYVFSSSMVNLNISSRQLETAVNLRVFDVPAANGFLLTDWKESLADLFDIKSEMIYYKSIEDLNEKIEFYAQNPHLKEKIIQKAKQRIAKEHLIQHRLEKILSVAQKIFA